MQLRPRRLREQALTPDIRAALEPLLRPLARPEGPWFAIGLGVILCLPALFAGFSLGDDLLRLAAADHSVLPVERAAFDLFSVLEPDADQLRTIANRTGLWGLPSDANLRAPRPLTSLLQAAELWAWPSHAWLMHLHSIAWFAVLLVVVGALYRRYLGGGWIAATGLLLFAIEDAHAPTVATIAERHQLIAAVLVAATLLAHHHWRRDAWSPGAWIGPSAFALALLCSETAVAALAYLLAYTLVLERAPGPQQWGAFAVYAAIAGAWLRGAASFGYSVVDPLTDPLATLAAVATHGPLLALGQLGMPFTEIVAAWPSPWAGAATVTGALAVACFGWTLAPLLALNPIARFWALGALLALVPACLGFRGDTALLFASIGFAPLLAQFFAAVVYTARNGRLDSLRQPVVAVLVASVILHVVAAPLLLSLRTLAPLVAEAHVAAIDATLPSDAALSDQQLVIVNAPDLVAGPLLLARRAASGSVLPASARVLAVHDGAMELTRAAEDRVTITLGSGMLRVPIDPARAPVTAIAAATFAAGDTVEIDGFVAEVTSADARGATEIEFRFDVPCDNESLRWVVWNGTGYEPFTPPALGDSVALDP